MYKYIYKYLGYDIYKEDKEEDRELDIEIGEGKVINIKYNKEDKRKGEKGERIRYIYNIIIIGILIGSIMGSLIYAIYINDSIYFTRSVYNIIFTLHYIYGIKYYKKDHIYKILKNNREMKKIYNMIIKISIGITIGITIGYVIILMKGGDIHVYSLIYKKEESNIKNISIIILLILNTIYNYITFFTTSTTFCIVMFYHKNIISTYTEKINNYIYKATESNVKMNSIAIEYTKMKDEFSKTVDYLNNFFVAMNIFGIIGTYITVNALQNGEYNIQDIINTCIFVIIEIIYIISIQIVRMDINNISNIITSSLFVSSIFKKYNIKRNIELNNNKQMIENIKNITENSLITILNIDENIDWIMLNNIINKKWDTFNIFGIEIDDSTILHKLLGFFIVFLFSKKAVGIL